MITLQRKLESDHFTCPYLEDREAINEYFLATQVNREELDGHLAHGWRKFGWYYFRPACKGCRACRPLRVLTKEFKASRSQRKVLNRNKETQYKVTPLSYRDEIYELYVRHSEEKFDQDSDNQQFIETHYFPSCPGMQSEVHVDGKLVAVGFLDCSSNALSSSYFFYDPDYSHLSLGTYGALKEIELASRLDLDYYYLGYWIPENKSMRYKSRFSPHELFDWESETWKLAEES